DDWSESEPAGRPRRRRHGVAARPPAPKGPRSRIPPENKGLQAAALSALADRPRPSPPPAGLGLFGHPVPAPEAHIPAGPPPKVLPADNTPKRCLRGCASKAAVAGTLPPESEPGRTNWDSNAPSGAPPPTRRWLAPGA